MTAALAGLATVFDWTVEQDELVRLQIPVLDGVGDPVDITGWSVDAQVKREPKGSVLHTWTGGDISIVANLVTLTILPATSLAWTWRRGWWRCYVTHPSDVTQRHRIVEGRFWVRPD